MPTSLPLSTDEAVALLNDWGASHTPFFFYTDYRGARWWAKPLSEITPEELRYALPLANNDGHRKRVRHFRWTIRPPRFEAYERAFGRVMAGLRRGDSFLTNLTWATIVESDLAEEDLFYATQAPFRLWVKGQFAVFSPEPFVTISADSISTYPMKGTIAASLPNAAERLLNDAKESAEHATIVDLLRNDLSTVASEVRVKRYRYLEEIETRQGKILQTSSEIIGKLRPDYRHRWGNILQALLPAGSVTGAPKRRTVEIIEAAEPFARGCYTGVFGVCDGEALQSAVMIRFVEFTPDGRWLFHSGGGVTAKSDVQSEFDELILKTHVPIS